MTAAGPGVSDGRVPGYLGRVLDGDGAPVGTCFQVAPGVLVTAWHVLDDIGAVADDARVLVDPLAGGDQFAAAVVRMDPLRDLAVLACDARLPAVTGPLTATDRMVVRTPVTATGHAVLEDGGSTYRFLTAVGQWAGGTTRDDAVPLGRMIADRVVPGMSGAPVTRDSDGAVAGVISGRYNSADGWPPSTAWVARTEDLAALLDGITSVTMQPARLSGPVHLVLAVTGDQVRLTGGGIDVSAGHGGVGAGMAEAVNETRRSRSRLSVPTRSRAEAEASAGEVPLSRAGRLLGESFLPEPVEDELGRVLAAAERAYQPVRLGLAVPPGLAGLPWEALLCPDGRGPLALHPLVSLYRKTETAAARLLPGPLRIVVAIAAPDTGGGAVLDYERELRNVLAAVRAARQDAADVRVVPFATVAAIREELDRGPAHVLHISGHGSPGTLSLENDDGTARPVTADEFLAQAIPPGRMPPVVTLSACYTDAAGSQGGASFAARLCQRGAAAVIATETSVTDTYATRLLARVYGTLARTRDPDIVAVLADARREVQAELETSPDARDNQLAGLGEWAAVTILAAAGSVPVLDPEHTARAAPGPSRPRIAGLAGRQDWYFVGRRPEQRRWPADLTGPELAGMVIYGIGGTGKTTLAAEITARVLDREPGRILVSMTGPLTLESLLGAVIPAIRRELLVRGQDDAAIRALDVAGRADLGWQDRLAVLRGHVLDHVPVLLLLDNFEDNLHPHEDAGYVVGDQVLAGLLAAWVADPGRSRLLVTCRYRFTLPGGAEGALSFRPLGALSRAETMKLAWSLPALDRLDEGQLEQVWRLAGGHPRSLEYLDALLASGQARYPDVTARLDAAITRRLSGADRGQWLSARTGLDAALAETVALAADDVLLEGLLGRLDRVPGAADLLLGISVYREPVDANAVLFQAGEPDPGAGHIPDQAAASQHIEEVLAAAGITVDESFDPASVPGHIQARLAPHIAELARLPVPPFRPGPGLPGQIAACQAASLLTVSEAGQQPWFFVHRWTATELAGRTAREPGQRLAGAHRQAAGYWRWRVRVWPQDKAADVHDLLEARHHLLQASDTEAAAEVTEGICLQLETWGAWDQEAALIHETLARLPPAPRVRPRGPGSSALWPTCAETSPMPPASTSAPSRPSNASATRVAWPPATTSSACSPRFAGTTTKPPASTSAPSTSANGSATRPAWPPPTTISAGSPSTGGTTTKPPASTSAPSTSKNGSATRPTWPSATNSSASSPRTAGTTTKPPASTSAPSTSANGSATRPARPTATTSSATSPRPAGTTTKPPASTSAPSTSANASATRPAWPPPTTISATSPRTAGTTTKPPASTSAPSTSTNGSATRPARPTATTISASSPRPAGTTTKPPASTSAPSTSTNGSATRPARPTATASSATSPRTAGTTVKPPASTSAPSTSKSGSATRPAWPPATTISASSPRPAGTTTKPPASTSAPSTSANASATRLARPPP